MRKTSTLKDLFLRASEGWFQVDRRREAAASPGWLVAGRPCRRPKLNDKRENRGTPSVQCAIVSYAMHGNARSRGLALPRTTFYWDPDTIMRSFRYADLGLYDTVSTIPTAWEAAAPFAALKTGYVTPCLSSMQSAFGILAPPGGSRLRLST